MDEVEQNHSYSRESFKNPQDVVGEAECYANLKEILRCFSSSVPNVKQLPGLTLDIGGVGMLQEWFQLYQDAIWSNGMVLEKNNHLQLISR